jgi:cell division topological specificity factor
MTIQKRISKILHYFQRPKKSAKVAKERLQIIIAHERGSRDKPDYLSALQKDLIDVVAKYVDIDKEKVKIELDRRDGCSILELNVMLPNLQDKKTGADFALATEE